MAGRGRGGRMHADEADPPKRTAMPLLDHFRPPLSLARRWESFHSWWAVAIADALNGDLLPADHFAEVQVHVGGRVEVDVATFAERPDGAGGVATAVRPARAWAPPAPALVLPGVFPDRVEVLIYHGEGGPTLVAAVELVSPGNKDREAARRAFAAKCVGYLQVGVGLVVVDVVTSRPANLHNELVAMIGGPDDGRIDEGGPYVVAYRPARDQPAGDRVEAWPASLAVGRDLPAVPLWISPEACVPLDLEAAYEVARGRGRIPS